MSLATCSNAPNFTAQQLYWLREKFAQPQYSATDNLSEANWKAGRASVVQELETIMHSRESASQNNKNLLHRR